MFRKLVDWRKRLSLREIFRNAAGVLPVEIEVGFERKRRERNRIRNFQGERFQEFMIILGC